jgi:hypothetical protein
VQLAANTQKFAFPEKAHFSAFIRDLYPPKIGWIGDRAHT